MSEVATVPLALDDLVPVVLAGVGALWLARGAARRDPSVQGPATLGALLILVGGLCKAGWKLSLAVTGDDVAVVADLLFVFLAPGFALLTWALLRARGARIPLAAAAGASVVAGGLAAAVTATWPLLVLAVVGATATGVLALLLARETGDLVAAGLFGLQLAMAYALVPFAGSGQSLAHQWWEQSLNTVGQGALALGAWRLLHPARVRSYA